jgi:putative transposase
MPDDQSLLTCHLFDPDGEVLIVERRLPHWAQAGAICFITWRTLDSMPQPVLDRWYNDRAAWLLSHGIDPQDPDWRRDLLKIDPQLVRKFLNSFWNRWHDELDSAHGDCVLRRPELARIVAQSLQHFDGVRYLMLDFVVMPNHVHLLTAFQDEASMLDQCESWKHYTATQINRHLKQKGRFWQQDGFDHLVRSEQQFEYLRQYIAENPARAGLRPGEFVHYSKTYTSSGYGSTTTG